MIIGIRLLTKLLPATPISVDLMSSFIFFNCSENHNEEIESQNKKLRPTKVFCLRCPRKQSNSEKNESSSDKKPENTHMILEEISEGSVVISNANLELIFDEETHLLMSIRYSKSK